MAALPAPVRRVLRRRAPARPVERTALSAPAALPAIDIAADDPLLAYATAHAGVITVGQPPLASPALAALRDAGVELIVPLVTHGELIGLLNLGPRLSERPYSGDDKRLLEELATHAAPAIRVAQLVTEQQAEAAERERMHQELRIAQLIQQQFLPRQLPDLAGWHIAAHYQPAREIGGDFYDFIALGDGKVGLVAGDVAGKGVPAALVMATTHSLLRAEAPRLVEPGAVLARVNDLLALEMPPSMFVTCLYAVLDPATGTLTLANAGHNLPYVTGAQGTRELRARGLPLGLMPEMTYESVTATIQHGERMLLHSDGLVEAHSPDGELFGFPRLTAAVAACPDTNKLIDALLHQLDGFVGRTWQQEDDITLVTLQRTPDPTDARPRLPEPQTLTAFDVPSEPGNERRVMTRVAEAVAPLGLPSALLRRLETAVGEAAMNAIEHGNHNQPELPVEVQVLVDDQALRVLVTDVGGDPHLPTTHDAAPDLDAKLAGLDSPRGWGLFLINSMVDRVTSTSDGHRHTLALELTLDPDREADAHHRV